MTSHARGLAVPLLLLWRPAAERRMGSTRKERADEGCADRTGSGCGGRRGDGAASAEGAHGGLEQGSLPQRMGFVRFGSGARSLLWIPDPSHSEPTFGYLRFMARTVALFTQAGYTVHLVGLPTAPGSGCR